MSEARRLLSAAVVNGLPNVYDYTCRRKTRMNDDDDDDDDDNNGSDY
jgi:hypothetical protein